MRTFLNSLATGAVAAALLGGVAAWPAFAADTSPSPGASPNATTPAPGAGGSSDQAPAANAPDQSNPGTAAAPSNTAQPDKNASQAEPAKKPKRHMAFSRKRVEHVQTALARSGEDVAIDGVWGPKTTAALKSFQKKNGLKATGRLNHATEKALPRTTS